MPTYCPLETTALTRELLLAPATVQVMLPLIMSLPSERRSCITASLVSAQQVTEVIVACAALAANTPCWIAVRVRGSALLLSCQAQEASCAYALAIRSEERRVGKECRSR